MSDNNNFMVINLATAECELGFATREQAKQFIKAIDIPEYTQADHENDDFDMSEDERTLIMPYYFNDTSEPDELTIYDNSNKNSKFSSVAEYYEDILNDDLIDTQDTPIRLQIA